MDLLKLTSEVKLLFTVLKEENTSLNKSFHITGKRLFSEAQLCAKDIKHLEETPSGNKLFFNNGMLINLYESKARIVIELIDTTSLPDPEKVIKSYLHEYVIISAYELEMLVDTLLQNYLILNYGEQPVDEYDKNNEIFIEFEKKTVFINPTTLEVYSLCKT